MTAVARQIPFIDKGGEQTPASTDIPLWLSTGMGAAIAMPASTPDPAAIVWRSATIPKPLNLYVSPTAVVIRVQPVRRAAPNVVEDLRAEGVTHEELAVWARSMMGGDTSDMLDI